MLYDLYVAFFRSRFPVAGRLLLVALYKILESTYEQATLDLEELL